MIQKITSSPNPTQILQFGQMSHQAAHFDTSVFIPSRIPSQFETLIPQPLMLLVFVHPKGDKHPIQRVEFAVCDDEMVTVTIPQLTLRPNLSNLSTLSFAICLLFLMSTFLIRLVCIIIIYQNDKTQDQLNLTHASILLLLLPSTFCLCSCACQCHHPLKTTHK